MTGRPGDSHPALNLVASDLFFGLGAVILVTVAALSLGLKDMVARVITDQSATPDETRAASASLAAQTGQTVLFADAAGLHRMHRGSEALIPLADLWDAPDLPGWLAEEPLVIIAASGQEAAFLTFSRAASAQPAPLQTLRLPGDCAELRATDRGYVCTP